MPVTEAVTGLPLFWIACIRQVDVGESVQLLELENILLFVQGPLPLDLTFS